MKMINANIKLPEALHEAMNAVAAARQEATGDDVKVCKIYREALELYLTTIDTETGLPKPPNVQLNLHPVTNFINADQDDAALAGTLEESSALSWVAAPDNACVFVTRALAEYAGRSMAQFLRLGWADSLHADDRVRTFEACRVGFYTRQPFRIVYRIRRADGMYGWIVDRAEPRYRNGRFAGYIGTMYEVATEADGAIPPLTVLPPQPKGEILLVVSHR